MKYLKFFESENNVNIESIIKNDIFLEFFDDDIAEVVDSDGDVICISIDIDDPEHLYNKENVDDLFQLYQRRANIYKRLKVAINKLKDRGIVYTVREIDETDGYILLDIFTTKFDSEYFQISSDDKIYFKADKLKSDFNLDNLYFSSNNTMVVSFKGFTNMGSSGAQLDAAEKLYKKLKTLNYDGEPIIKPVPITNMHDKPNKDLPNDQEVPFGPHYIKGDRKYAEISYNRRLVKGGTGYYDRGVYVDEYKFGITDKFKIGN